MALAAVRSGGSRKQHLAAVEAEPEDAKPQASLADRLAAAEAAVTEPQRRVAELEAGLAAAIEASDFAAAAVVQEQLPAARQALALATVNARALAETQAAIEQERQATERAIQEARQRDEAKRIIEAASAAERQALDQVDAALGVMRGHLAAAKGALQRAQGAEAGVIAARRQAVQAQVMLGEFEAPGPRVFGPSTTQALADTDVLVRELIRWCP